MSASSKKKLRKEQESVKLTEQQIAAQKEAKKLNLYTTIFVVVLALLLVTAITVGVRTTIANSGVRERKTTALTVDSHSISNAELNYFYIDAVNNFMNQYGSYASLFGLDTTKPLNQQVVDPETGLTWADDFLSSAKESAKSTYALADAANAAGFALSEEQVSSIEQSVANIEVYAKLYGFSDAESYLQAMYGKGAAMDSFLEFNKLTALANAYYSDYAKNLTYTDADLRALEAEDPAAFTSFTYNTYYLSASSFLTGGTTDDEGNTTYSDEEKAAAAAAAETAVKELTAEGVNSVATLDAAIAALPVNVGKTVASNENKDVLGSKLSSVYGDWIRDGARKPGNVASFPSTSTDDEGNETVNGYNVVLFRGIDDNTVQLPNVRHILLAFEGGSKDETTGQTVYSDEEKAAAKAAAEEVLAQWKAGEATEESFAALANDKSADGDGTTGGLYENIQPGQMVESFNDWCFDAARKPGDTGIVETQYGYHVMFFSGDSRYNYRDYMIETQLRSADTSDWYAKTMEAVTATDGDTSYIRMDLVVNNK